MHITDYPVHDSAHSLCVSASIVSFPLLTTLCMILLTAHAYLQQQNSFPSLHTLWVFLLTAYTFLH
jgi:hypothetical protein